MVCLNLLPFLPACARACMRAFSKTLLLAGLLASPSLLLAVNCPGNTFYWVSAGAANWNVATNWSNSSGGATCNQLPFSTATAVFDSKCLGTCNINVPVTVSSMTITEGTQETKPNSNFLTKFAGYWINNGGVFIVNNSTVSFTSTASEGRVRSRGSPFRNVFIGSNTTGGYYTLQDSMTVSTITI